MRRTGPQRYEYPVCSRRLKLTAEQQGLINRRTMPFLDHNGLTRPLSVVLAEVYMQGMRDAHQALTETD